MVRGRAPMAVFYSPKEYKAWQTDAARRLAEVEAPSAPLEGPVEVELRFFVTKPKTSKLPHPKPDIDNYAKGVLDVMTTDGRFWNDDTQVQRLIASKEWGAQGQIQVSVRSL